MAEMPEEGGGMGEKDRALLWFVVERERMEQRGMLEGTLSGDRETYTYMPGLPTGTLQKQKRSNNAVQPQSPLLSRPKSTFPL